MSAPSTGLAQGPVSFTASATSPSPVDQAAGFTYLWNFGDGTTGSGASPTHAYALDGIYTVTATATDCDGAKGTASSVVKVYPSVSAGPDPTASEGQTVNFVGTAVGSSSLSYNWTFGDGTTATGTLTPSHVYNERGTYTATLTATDMVYGFSSSSSIPMTITDVAPTVTIAGPSSGTVQAPVSLTASATSPSPIDQAAGFTYLWNFGDGTTGSGASPPHSYALDGIYTVTVTATDCDGATGTGSTSVKVYPVALAGSNLTGNEGSTFNFQGSAIGGSLSYSWNFGDGGTATGTLTPSHVYSNQGTYTATLTVTDSAGLSSQSSLSVTVIDVAPTVSLTAPATGTTGSPVSFSASATDPSPVDQAAGYTYSWIFGDGTTGTGASPTHSYASAGTYTVSVTATATDGAVSQPANATLTISTTPQVGITYYIAPNTTSGSGTFSNPFGLPDLLNTSGDYVTQGQALAILKLGDTLDFLGGDYHISGTANTGCYDYQLICPTVSGTATQPITIQAYPGQTVRIFVDSGVQPAFGTDSPTLNYVRFLGFTVEPTPIYTSGGILESPQAFNIHGTGDEVAYNEIIGQYVATGDNHDGIRLADANSTWVHNNYIHGFEDIATNPDNGAGIKVYGDTNDIVEDNYITECSVGISDKYASVWPNNQTYRRNWVAGNTNIQFKGNNQGTQALYFIYDNVFDGSEPINLVSQQTGTQIYNNLLRGSSSQPSGSVPPGQIFVLGGSGSLYQNDVWNNVFMNGGSGTPVVYQTSANYVQSGATAQFAYWDYNVYDAAPAWNFGNGSYTLSTWQGQGWDAHSTSPLGIVTDSTIYPGIGSGNYTLASAYQTAGRYGGAVGPRVAISGTGGIMDPTRYGPGALSTGSSPSITQQPQNQAVPVGGTATFSVQVNGSGLFYQWQRSNDGGTTWIVIQGANSASYTTPQVSTSDYGAIFRSLVSSVGGSAWSGLAILTVTSTSTNPMTPAIMLPSSSQTMTAGTAAAFTGVTSGTAPAAVTPVPTSTVQTVSALMAGVQNGGADPGSSPAFEPSVNSRHAHHAFRAKTAPPITRVSAYPRRTPVQWSKGWRPTHLV
jgi:PKD repeat protein